MRTQPTVFKHEPGRARASRGIFFVCCHTSMDFCTITQPGCIRFCVHIHVYSVTFPAKLQHYHYHTLDMTTDNLEPSLCIAVLLCFSTLASRLQLSRFTSLRGAFDISFSPINNTQAPHSPLEYHPCSTFTLPCAIDQNDFRPCSSKDHLRLAKISSNTKDRSPTGRTTSGDRYQSQGSVANTVWQRHPFLRHQLLSHGDN